MDYKYIENLVERYFDCQTNLQEETILKSFFTQQDIPSSLEQYRPLFNTLAEEEHVELPADFDTKLMERLHPAGKAATQHPSWIVRLNHSLVPFYKAVASVALVITAGVAATSYWDSQDPDPVNYNYAGYHETYSDPQVAYSQVSDALKDLSNVFNGDSIEGTNSKVK